jgi:hypothetical protein
MHDIKHIQSFGGELASLREAGLVMRGYLALKHRVRAAAFKRDLGIGKHLAARAAALVGITVIGGEYSL